ncbi:hypothetical protein MGSAQ_001442 [marine sediment metagenome]|uniref:Uncharacterized protein n=1 Tax=marine sediment metagenome TaxID=412755 RepID=A0A1B6NVR7_9ZZZZ
MGTGRISPDKPTSPNTANDDGNGFSLMLEAHANNTAKSDPVSMTLTPPTTLT